MTTGWTVRRLHRGRLTVRRNGAASRVRRPERRDSGGRGQTGCTGEHEFTAIHPSGHVNSWLTWRGQISICYFSRSGRGQSRSDPALTAKAQPITITVRFDALGMPRPISLDTIRDAARRCIAPPSARRSSRSARCEPGRSGDLPEARDAAADRLVQDPRRLQRRPPADAGAARRGRLDGQRRQRRAGRRARRAQGRRPLLRAGHGHRARHEARAPSSGSARRSSRRPTTSAGGPSKTHRSDRMPGHFVHPFDDDRFHQRQRHGRPRDPRGSAGRRRRHRAARRRRAAGRHRAPPCTRCGPTRASTPPSRRRRRRSPRRSRAGAASRFDDWQASFVDGAGGKSVLPTMWPLLQRSA